ncbi:hypothetical protein JCM5296_003626 [Sporobolomyces johnsonii]
MVHQANKSRRPDSPLFTVGSKAYVSTSGLRFPAGVASKFVPKFIGPFPITAADPSKSSYTLAFPPHLKIHPHLHASRLRPHFPNDDDRFPSRALAHGAPVVDASDGVEAEWVIEKVVAVKVVRGKRLFKVRYLGYSAAEDQFRPEAELRETAPEMLDAFLAQQAAVAGARDTVPRKSRRRIAGLLVSLASHTVSSLGGVGARIT